MAGPRTLDPERLSLSELYFELLYSTLRLRHAPETKALVSDAEKQLAEVERVIGVERNKQTLRIDGEVQVDWRNYDVDAWLAAFRSLLALKRGGRPGQQLFDRFFANRTPSEIIRMALRPELAVVSRWVASLKAETDVDLSKQGAALELLVIASNDAVGADDAAIQGMRDFRAGLRLETFNNANNWRQSLHAELGKLDKGKEWVQSFFRPGRRRREDPALTLHDAEAAVKALRAELAEAEATVEEVKKRDAELALKSAEKEKRQQALEEARQKEAELKRHIAELESGIED
jgi:hypothetical protein